MRSQLYAIYSKATGRSEAQIAEDCERNNWLTSPEMLKYGLIDSVLDKLQIRPPAA